MSFDFQFQGGERPACMDGADTDDSGQLNLTDAIIVFQWLFLGDPGGRPIVTSRGAIVNFGRE